MVSSKIIISPMRDIFGEERGGAGDVRDWKQKGGEEVLRRGIFGQERGGEGRDW